MVIWWSAMVGPAVTMVIAMAAALSARISPRATILDPTVALEQGAREHTGDDRRHHPDGAEHPGGHDATAVEDGDEGDDRERSVGRDPEHPRGPEPAIPSLARA